MQRTAVNNLQEEKNLYQLKRNPNAPYQKIKEACKTTGLSQYYLRAGCRDGSIPCIRCNGVYFVNIPAFLQQLDEQSKSAKAVNA